MVKKMAKTIDFDKLFDDFLNNYLSETLGKISADKIEQEIPAKYVKWLNTQSSELGGKTPQGFIDDLKSNGKLGEYVLQYVKDGEDISSMIAEACGEDEVDVLMDIIKNYPEYACPACSILKDISTTKADKLLLDVILNPESQSELVDMAIETLSDGTHENIVNDILNVMDEVDDITQRNLIDVLYVYTGNTRIYEWLVKIFTREDENRALYCAYLGSYGNPDAIDVLLSYADDSIMDYYEFMELRNAVERLGGEMPKDKKYQVIKKGGV